ncbi:hypothetical protein CI594_06810 [Fischerella thermalis CCMEE 5196]|nr:hypothetical protein CI594_06810 [Fischerella thermalis CCMEE 5196]
MQEATTDCNRNFKIDPDNNLENLLDLGNTYYCDHAFTETQNSDPITFTLCLRVLVFQPITTQTPSNIIRPLVKIVLPHPNPKRNHGGGEHRWTQIDYPLRIFGKMNK